MIKTLYPIFQHWSEKGSVYLLSDTLFADSDCKLMDPDWISPEEQVSMSITRRSRIVTMDAPLLFCWTSALSLTSVPVTCLPADPFETLHHQQQLWAAQDILAGLMNKA